MEIERLAAVGSRMLERERGRNYEERGEKTHANHVQGQKCKVFFFKRAERMGTSEPTCHAREHVGGT